MENEKETVVDTTDVESNDFDLSALTAKNSDYVHSVTRGLLTAGKSDDEVKTILTDIVPQIVAAQKTGVTARNLLGTPTEFIEGYKPKEADRAQKYTNTDPKFMILDSILLLFSLLAGLYGVMMEFNKTGVSYGLTTLTLSSIVGGLALYQIYRNQLTASQKKGKQSFWERTRPTLLLIAYMAVWVVVTSVTAFLPAAINPLLNGVVMIILGVAVFGVRYLLKRRFKIVSAMTTRPRN